MLKPVAIILDTQGGPSFLEARSMRPVGSWLHHPMCKVCETFDEARDWIVRTNAAEDLSLSDHLRIESTKNLSAKQG